MPKLNLSRLNKMGTCPFCGHRNLLVNKKCSTCGAELSGDVEVRDKKTGEAIGTLKADGTFIKVKKPGCISKVLNFLGWLYIFPLMLTIIAFKKKTKIRWIVAGIGWIVYILIIIWLNNLPESSTARNRVSARTETPQAVESTNVVSTSEPVFTLNTPPALISIETMPGIESWKADAFFEEFSALTGYAIPEAYAGEEGYSRRAYDADNGSCRTDYHVTENDAGKVAEAFFNFDTGCPRAWLAEIAALTAVGTDYQKELVGFIKSFDGKKAIENIYGDGWYKVDTGGNGETVQLIIWHFQYDEYLDASSGL